jgi:hypothetical protein
MLSKSLPRFPLYTNLPLRRKISTTNFGPRAPLDPWLATNPVSPVLLYEQQRPRTFLTVSRQHARKYNFTPPSTHCRSNWIAVRTCLHNSPFFMWQQDARQHCLQPPCLALARISLILRPPARLAMAKSPMQAPSLRSVRDSVIPASSRSANRTLNTRNCE